MDGKKEIADRVIARWKDRGFVLDGDPHYMRLVELWIEGEISGAEMRQRYAQFLADRAGERAGRAEPAALPIGLDPVGLWRSDGAFQRVDADPPAAAEEFLDTD
ncbi:hypothetical protein [Rhizobium redzepovicii]|uniref:hypothetical protein n=1 Tax=Rhizobium redzepovicii TaxID=2867518 RepID=UPI00287195D7|nr:hypothetical protein [Rhizobium redzepovicii]MDR9781012.1 hypothetical protein [Rhizobium redzepovicii]